MKDDDEKAAVEWHKKHTKIAVQSKDKMSYENVPFSHAEAVAEVKSRKKNKVPLTGWNTKPQDEWTG